MPHGTTYLIDNISTRCIQSIVGYFIYYVRAIDNTILPTLNEIAMNQASSTQ